MSDAPGTLYLLHFGRDLGNPSTHTARHYLGWAENVTLRLDAHLHGRGAKITAAAVEQGITLELVWTRPGTRRDERKLHDRAEHARLCPYCRADWQTHRNATRRAAYAAAHPAKQGVAR